MSSAIWLPLEAAPMSPGHIPSLFVPCDKCVTPGVCKVEGQCELLRRKAIRKKHDKERKQKYGG